MNNVTKVVCDRLGTGTHNISTHATPICIVFPQIGAVVYFSLMGLNQFSLFNFIIFERGTMVMSIIAMVYYLKLLLILICKHT